MTKLTWILLVFASLFEVCGDIVLKYWAETDKNVVLWAGLAVYFAAGAIWAFSLRGAGLAKATVIVNMFILIIAVAFGVLFFKETLTPTQKFGIVLSVVAVFLVGE